MVSGECELVLLVRSTCIRLALWVLPSNSSMSDCERLSRPVTVLTALFRMQQWDVVRHTLLQCVPTVFLGLRMPAYSISVLA